MGKSSLQTSERTEIYSAAGVSSFTGSLPGIRVPVPPAADQVGRAGADHLTSFEEIREEIRCQGGNPVSEEIRCRCIILARKDEPTSDYAHGSSVSP